MYSFKVHDVKPIADKMRTVPADSTVRPECGWGIIDVTGVKNGRLD